MIPLGDPFGKITGDARVLSAGRDLMNQILTRGLLPFVSFLLLREASEITGDVMLRIKVMFIDVRYSSSCLNYFNHSQPYYTSSARFNFGSFSWLLLFE